MTAISRHPGINPRGVPNLRSPTILLSILIMVSAINLMDSGMGGEAYSTRFAGEDIHISVLTEMAGATTYTLSIEVEAHAVEIEGEILTSDQIRAINNETPVSGEVKDTLTERAMGVARGSFKDDTLTLIDGSFKEGTLDNSSGNSGKPIEYNLEIQGRIPIRRFLSDDMAQRVPEDRFDHVATGLLISGFTYNWGLDLMAEAGERVTYLLPSSFDPYGDGEVSIILSSNLEKMATGYYIETIEGGSTGSIETTRFIMSGSPAQPPEREELDGTCIIDWFDLDMIKLGLEIQADYIDIEERAILDGLPDAITSPASVPAGSIRHLFLEGVLVDDDLEQLEGEIGGEVEEDMLEVLDVEDILLEITVETGHKGLALPEDGGQLLSIIGSEDPIGVDIRTPDPVQLDILDNHSAEDVFGLLNGGLRIQRDFNIPADLDFDIHARLPEGLLITNEDPIQKGERWLYELTAGFKDIASIKAPVYNRERIVVESDVDLSDIDSIYFSDATLKVSVYTTISLHHMEFDPGDFEIDTTLDYTLDYINSDTIRLLIEMDILDRSEVEETILEEHGEIFDELVPDEGREETLEFLSGSLEFDGDRDDMTGDDPVSIRIELRSVGDPFSESFTGNVIVPGRHLSRFPHHFDPIIPIKTIERSVDLPDDRGWDYNITIRFPTGVGVEAYLVNSTSGNRERLDTVIENGYPTIRVSNENGWGDRMDLKLSFGAYFGFANVGICFFSVWILLGILLLLIVVKVIKRIVKGRRGRSEEASSEEGGENEAEVGAREENSLDVS